MSPLSPVTPLPEIFECPAPSDDALDLVDDMRLDEIEDLASKAISYWISLREGAIRGEPMTIATHFRQVRETTFAAFLIIRDLGQDVPAPLAIGRAA